MSTMIWERTGVRIPGNIELSWNRLGLACALIFDSDSDSWPWMLHIHLLFLNLFVHFPAPRIAEDRNKYGEWQTFGFSLVDDSVHFNWGYKCRVKAWPWAYRFLKNEVFSVDGLWVPYVGSWEQKDPDRRKTETFGYAYILKSGEVQHRMAEVYVERYTWRRRWLYWTSWRQMERTSINVTFSDEVGERSGSWKGGTIGCSYEMKPRESVERCLRRMEQERKF